MAIYIYTIMVTRKNENDKEYKSKLFEFTNERSAKKSLKKLIGEMERLSGEKAFPISFGECISYYASGDDYYNITYRKHPATTPTDSNINFQFEDNED